MFNSEIVEIRSQSDIVVVRQRVRALAIDLRFSLIEQTKIVTAASELARNTLDYGKGGTVTLEIVDRFGEVGLKLTFEDQGPGIVDIELALQDGYTTGKGLGLGLGGAKRLMSEFVIVSEVGKGTQVTVIRWQR
ncbi:anti-sigma regulatory factor [Leptolyngbya sp. NIES-2104]|uniref:anti-sigma regulatory factor n=1 Tax=Leptolyngbya sp. NIES-2104 TaxID=1552121 RepID=UPI0006ECABE8|nr:anti-sigma regulatory factor [Leptolyngbya sp. NIES-2104]GAP96959.1 anti-sigma B factor RsbT [Leptolyngbya sp. NIES-2104]